MRTSFSFQPFAGDLGLLDVLSSALANEAYDNFTAVVAWARPSGLKHLEGPLMAFRERGGYAEIVVGIDEGGASIEGLQSAVALFDRASVLHDPAGGTFHPKIYVFQGEGEALLIIGSNNLTAGGLYYNYEAAHVTALDLSLSPDLQVILELEDFLERLKVDRTCLSLTDELISAFIADGRFGVKSESERRRTGFGKEDSFADIIWADRDRLFEPSIHHRRYVRSTKSSGEKRRKSSVRQIASSSVVAGGSTGAVVARWTKTLTRSDCGQPNPNSNTTAALRFTKAGHPITQATWFRDVLFANADWVDDPTRTNRERASVRFDVEIYGEKLGTHVLALKYDPHRDAGQNNFTTDLKWGSLTQPIRQRNLVGSIVTVERLSDDSFRLIINSEPAGDFLDQLSMSRALGTPSDGEEEFTSRREELRARDADEEDALGVTAEEAAEILGITGLRLRNRLRATRPADAKQVPNREYGRWLLSRRFVEELAVEYGVRVPW